MHCRNDHPMHLEPVTIHHPTAPGEEHEVVTMWVCDHFDEDGEIEPVVKEQEDES